MASTEQLIKEAVLSPALANVALLIAAPSLGCLKTYTKSFTDLCGIYDLHIPDLAQILQYSPTASPSSSIRSSKTDCLRKATQVSHEFQKSNIEHIKIKKEPEDSESETVEFKQEIINNKKPKDPMCDTVKVKQEIINNNALYNVCIYDTKPTTLGTSLEMHVKSECTKLEIPIDIALKIPSKRKVESKIPHTKPSIHGTMHKKHVKTQDTQLETPFDHALVKMEKLSKSNAISNVSFQEQKGTIIHGASQVMSASNEGQPKIHQLKEDISPDDILSVNTDQYSTMLGNITKSLTNSKCLSRSISSMLSPKTKTSIYSIIDSTGKIRVVHSMEKATEIMAKCGMPFEFSNSNQTQFKSCLVHVGTSNVELKSFDTIRYSVLGIWSKNENKAFKIPFENIRDVSTWNSSPVNKGIKYNNIIKVCYYSTKTESLEYLLLRATKGKVRPQIISWLFSFLG